MMFYDNIIVVILNYILKIKKRKYFLTFCAMFEIIYYNKSFYYKKTMIYYKKLYDFKESDKFE